MQPMRRRIRGTGRETGRGIDRNRREGSFYRQAGLFRRLGGCFLLCCCLVLGVRGICPGGMDVMTNAELSEVEGGDIQVDISQPGYYGGGTSGTTVVRFAADIYTEVYAHVGALRLGHYNRTSGEMGRMAVLHSSEIARFENIRTAPRTYWSNYNTRINGFTFPDNFGLPSGPEWTQWDISFEHLQVGDYDAPARMYGLIFRTEFANWGTQSQELERIILGTNQMYGYAGMRPLVTSGYITFNLAHLTAGMGTLIATPRFFQLTRDPMADLHWSLSSIHANPISSNQNEPSTRELWFNCEMNHDSINKIHADNGPYAAGKFDDHLDDHGAFLSLDFTNNQFRGWNLIAGVNEYEEWVNFGAADGSPIIRLEELGTNDENDY